MRLLVVRCLAFAVVQAETMARGNAGAICSTGEASYALTVEKDSAGAFTGARYVSPALGRAVLNDDARAGRPSNAMIGTRRRCSWTSRAVMPLR